jgi:hypothetical protein
MKLGGLDAASFTFGLFFLLRMGTMVDTEQSVCSGSIDLFSEYFKGKDTVQRNFLNKVKERVESLGGVDAPGLNSLIGDDLSSKRPKASKRPEATPTVSGVQSDDHDIAQFVETKRIIRGIYEGDLSLVNFANMSELLRLLRIRVEDGFCDFSIPASHETRLQEMARQAGFPIGAGGSSGPLAAAGASGGQWTLVRKLKLFVLLYAFQNL